MSEGISESRFNMWRAVFAMAHADHVVTDEEKEFMEGYLDKVPFSEAQRQTLQQDMTEAQDVYTLFSLITVPEDRSEFFQFARELCWCDGDYDAQEEEIKEKLKAAQMSQINLDRLELELAKTRAEAKMQRTAEERKLNSKADSLLSLKPFLQRMVGREDAL